MSYTKKKFLDRVLAMFLTVMMVIAMLPMNVFALENTQYATVTTYTGGEIKNNGTANVEVVVEETTLNWVEANALRAEGWWVGIDVVAPAGYSVDATYKVKTNPTAEYGEAKNFAEMKDGENDIQLWFPVSAESLKKFASEDRNLTMTYAFDWDANEEYEQTIVFSVVPSEKIVLTKNGEQVYPKIVNYGTVSTLTGGTIKDNGTANVEVLVEETTLQWVAANALRAEGWWVGIDVVAPDDFSADATYKVKTNPTATYGTAKNFAEMKDGEKDIQLWFPVSRESLEKFASEGRNLTMTYAFDWDADGEYEQEVAFSVAPSEKIVLMKGEDQVYPVLKSTVTVSKNEGGSVSLNGDTTGTLVVENGSTVNVVVEAATGYQISKVAINGNETVVDAKDFSTAIENIAADATVSVTFVKLYTVTVTGNDKGSVSTTPAGQGGSVTVVDGSKVTVTATPETGYRVSGVKINGVDQAVSGANNSGYTVELTADTEYSVEVTFAPNIYKVEKEATDNGDFEIKNPSVEHGGSTVVVVTPSAGYTVDTFKVDDASVSNITKDETGIWFTVSDIKSDVKVVVTFKATAKANTADVSKDTENVALRKNELLFVVKDGDSITFKTEKTGMRMYGDLGLIAGDAATQTITIPGDTTITSIELYYKADGELYADWHVVEMQAIKIVVDAEKTESTLTPNAANENGYYNSDVTFAVKAEDKDDFSGIALVEYWITLNDVPGQTVKLYEYQDGTEVKAVHEDSIVVNAATYNSKNVKVTLRVLDRAGNEEIVEKEIKINSTKPTVSLAINGTQNNNAKETYYNDKRELTITIIDREDTFSQSNVAKGLEIYKNGALVEVAASDITWKHTAGSNQYEGTYVFADDAHYEWSFAYTNIAGLSNDGVTVDTNSKDIYDFYVDKAEPYSLAINYNPNFVGVLLDTITFGFYGQDSIEVSVEAIDDTAGIEQFECTYGDVTKTISGADITRVGNKAFATFSVPAQFRGSVSVKAVDRAGRTAELADNKVVVIDTIAPGVTVTWDPAQGYNGKYFNTDRTATIEIEEANFFAQDVEDGLLNITAHIVYNDGSTKDETYKPTFTFENGKYVANITFEEEADYTFDVTYTDRSGNVYDEYPAEEFTIDKTNPVISVKYDNNSAINENQFKAERTATITVVEHNFFADEMAVKVNGSEYAVAWNPVDGEADTYTAEVPFPGDAHYTFAVSGKDYADNANNGVAEAAGTVAPWAFTVDKSSPVDLKISYDPTFVGTLLEGVTFGFYKAPVTVKIEATDDISGIDYFTYSYIVQDGVSTINVGKEKVKVDANGANFVTFDIPAQFRGFVSFEVTNKAGVSASTADVNAVVVDDIAPGVQVIYGNYDALNDKYYKADRTATITIEEANYFAKDIEDGLLVITRKAVANDGTITEETLAPQFTKIENSDKYVATIDFDQDADYTFDIKYTDRSGNVYDDYDADEFTVDKIAPKISIEKANGAYFNTDRTAKITVVEHNFRASDFIFTADAYTVLGKTDANKIDISSKAYQTYLQNQDNWTKVAADTWEAEITFDIEGNYVIGATYSDLAGNAQVEAISDTFCVDKTDPDNLKITYEPTFVGVLLENLTFGFYKAPVKVTIEATDDIAGVEYFVYSYTVQDGASNTNVGLINQNVTATRDGSTNRWYTTFTIEPQFRGNVSFTAYDKATNKASLADANVVVVDNVAPGINVEYDNNNHYDEWFYKGDRTATITITEANFFAQDIADGLLVITVEKTLNDGTYTSTKMSPTFIKNGDIYTATIPFTEEADYTFDIKYTDRSGNVYDSYEKDIFTVDKTAPVIDVTYDNNNAKNNDQFKANRVATITVTEHNFRADYVVAKVMASGTEVTSYAEYLKNDANWKHYTLSGVEVDAPEKGDVHVAKITYSEEAHYTFEIACTDKAGNISGSVNYGNSVAPTAFTLDKSAPTDMQIKIADKSVKGSMSTHAFDTFYGATVTVKLSANCDISGLESLKYQKVADVSEYKIDGTWVDYNDQTGIVVAPNEKFVIYFRAEDRAGNVEIVRSTGIVVDDQMPIGETNAPEIDILPAAPNANGMHKADVSVDLKVVDPKYAGTSAADNGHYSGLNKITYKIYTTDTDAVEEGTLLALGSKTEGAVFDADKLVSSWSGKITIDSEKFNSNNVVVEVIAVDNAGNERKTTTKVGDIQIDITAPTIVVSYDNNSADSETFFKDDRTATVVITERNFNAKDVVVTIKNTDGVVPTISDFTKSAGTGNGDDTTWTATIKYTADGDYEFDIAYTDLAENACAGETFAEGTVASNAFTIDHTIPVIQVTYDNNDALNGNYYKAYRTATVVITEHNFNAERVTITHTATDDGAETTKPTISGWKTDGDKHTATIYYGKDAKYTFDIAVNDKAGNASADYTEETFFVDTTMPTLEITGVADQSANNGDVIPVVSYSDTNYDADKVTITLNGANRKSVELDGSYADIHNGRTFTFKNFAKEQAIDDIYTLTATLTDKAGNTTEKTITFSVNRFGSTYALSEDAEKLNGTYVKEPVDVVITETNADELSNIKVTLFKDGETKVLAEGTDYKIDVAGGNGQWYHYTYTIFAKNFDADGVYSLTVESDDKAGNEAKNDQDTKDKAINFGVDSTLPIINIENLESKTTYALDNMTVTMSVKDNLKLTKVIVELDGAEYKTWSAEELEEIIKNGGNFSFDIAGDSTDAHNLVVYAIDAAGNGEKISDTELPANAEEVEDFYVTTNLWVRYYTNKPLFFGSIAGVIVLAGLIVFLVVYKKKKNEK